MVRQDRMQEGRALVLPESNTGFRLPVPPKVEANYHIVYIRTLEHDKLSSTIVSG